MKAILLGIVFLAILSVGLTIAYLIGRGRRLDVYKEKNRRLVSTLSGILVTASMFLVGLIAGYGTKDFAKPVMDFLLLGVFIGWIGGIAIYLRLASARRSTKRLRNFARRKNIKVPDRKIMGVNVKDVLESNDSDHKE